MKTTFRKLAFLFSLMSMTMSFSQYMPKKISQKQWQKAQQWVDKTYNKLSQNEKLGQLFIVALYTNKGEDFIQNVRTIVEQEQIGGVILMQDNAQRHIALVNEFQQKSKVPMLIGMDAEWGLYQRIDTAYKFPWAITLGAIQNKKIIYKIAEKIASDCRKMGVNWDFAPVVDVNTNPSNPIIGNRSFGSDVANVIHSASAYTDGLQDNRVLGAIKHFPGHGDTDTDSHLELPIVNHNLHRLNEIELTPFKELINNNIGGIMIAHLYVPSLEPQQGVPASISPRIVTDLLKQKLNYKGLIITDALNMKAVADRYPAGKLDALAFKAGNDIMLFSQAVAEGKKKIAEAINKGEIPQSRVEESVKKILLTKYFLGLKKTPFISSKNINKKINTPAHQKIAEKAYANALTLIKDSDHLLPLDQKTYYYIPLEESDYQTFAKELQQKTSAKIIVKKTTEIESIPKNSTVIISFHKDNSTAYKPYKISEDSKNILAKLSENQKIILSVFGSPYALQDVDISKISTVLVAYENNDDSMKATAKAIIGKAPILGRLPVIVNEKLPYGTGIDKK